MSVDEVDADGDGDDDVDKDDVDDQLIRVDDLDQLQVFGLGDKVSPNPGRVFIKLMHMVMAMMMLTKMMSMIN